MGRWAGGEGRITGRQDRNEGGAPGNGIDNARGLGMGEEPQERTEERRRRGPLGDEEGGGESGAETQRVPLGEEGGTERRSQASEGTGPRRGRESAAGDDDGPETRVIRTPGAEDEEATYPRGYLEALDERESRLREIYGGVDWLASFIGCIFAVVSGSVLLALLALVLTPLGFTLDLAGQQVGAAIITGLVVIGVALFVAYLFGGYVAGRLARYDGGRNGAMTVAWALALTLLVAAVGSFLPGPLFEVLQEFVQSSVLPALGALTELGLAGAGIIVGALLLELLGGFLGGRLGNRYHTRINQTT